MQPQVTSFFDEPTNTYSYVVKDPHSSHCAVIDSVLNFDYASGHTTTESADEIIRFIDEHSLTVDWILETHVHADHLSAAPYLHLKLGAKTGIGAHIKTVQQTFGQIFNAETTFSRDGSQFDQLFMDGDHIQVGHLKGKAIHTPGHTPACMTYVFALPDETRLFMCHDYKAKGRDHFANETTVADERLHNIHVGNQISEQAFVKMRTERDATLGMPKLIIPSVQINMRAGHLPPAEDNGQIYLKVPINLL